LGRSAGGIAPASRPRQPLPASVAGPDRVAAELGELVEEQHTVVREGSDMYLDPTSVVASVPVAPRNFGTLASTPLGARRPLPASPLADHQQQTRDHDE